MIQVNCLGNQWIHCFQFPDGSLKIQRTTEDDYKQLNLPNPIYPKLDGAVWFWSCETPLFDTATGFLPDNCYSDLDGKNALVSINGVQKTVLLSDISDTNKIMAEISSSLIQQEPTLL